MSSGLKESAKNGNGRDVRGEGRREAKGYPVRARGKRAVGEVECRAVWGGAEAWAAEAWAPDADLWAGTYGAIISTAPRARRRL